MRYVLGEAPDTWQRSDTESTALTATYFQLLRFVAGRLALFVLKCSADRQGRVEIIIAVA